MDAVLGQLVDASTERDAIHVAIAPVQASQNLMPGWHVGIGPDGKAGPSGKHIGIVDPFLGGTVSEGQWFYLCLYPQTVTGMRHHWSHPAFGTVAKIPEPEVAEPLPEPDEPDDPKEWIAKFADGIRQDYDDLMGDAEGWIRHGDYTYDNSESYKSPRFGTWDEFWKKYEAVTGTELPEVDWGHGSPYTCSC